MSVYRLHTGGAWSQASHIGKLEQQLEMIPAYSEVTEDVFKAEFDLLASHLSHTIAVTKMVQMAKFSKSELALVKRITPRIFELIPPILLLVVKWLTPPLVKRVLVQRLLGKHNP